MHFFSASLLALTFGLHIGEAIAATPASSCLPPPTPSPVSPAAYRCNTEGKLSNPSLITKFHGSTGDYTACYTACLASSGCRSFSYNSNNGYCNTYSKDLVPQGFNTSATTLVYYWNLEGCFTLPSSCRPKATPTPTNVVKDGSFEMAPDPAWKVQSIVCGAGRAQDGNCAAQLSLATNGRTGNTQFANQTLTGLTPGKSYAINFYYSITNFQTNGEQCVFGLILNDDSQPFFLNVNGPTNGYVKAGPTSYTAEAATEVMSFLFGCASTPYNITLLLDNVSMVG